MTTAASSGLLSSMWSFPTREKSCILTAMILSKIHIRACISAMWQTRSSISTRISSAHLIISRMTTRNLYDTVIGIGNVQIRLYKIEAQREYPTTWAEATKNSGGEGFLSASVILSSLLHYMRKDETDIFADRNEGNMNDQGGGTS